MITNNKTKLGKKASVLIVSMLMVFVIFVLYIAIHGIAEQISSTKYVGQDAAKLTEMKQESYKQRFFIEISAQKIIDAKTADFNKLAAENLPKKGEKIILENATYKLDLLQYAAKWLENQTNLELPIKTQQYNDIVIKNKENDESINLIARNNYTLIEKDGNIYGIAKNVQKITKINKNSEHSYYYYWPHFTAKTDFLTNISVIYEAKELFIRCRVTKSDDTCIKLVNEQFYPTSTTPMISYSPVDKNLYIKEYVFTLTN